MGRTSTDNATADDFKKVVISLWFRVPLETLQAVRDKADTVPAPDNSGTLVDLWGLSYVPMTMAGIVPLVTFGRAQSAPIYKKVTASTGSVSGTAYQYPGGDRNFPGDGPWTADYTFTVSYSTEAVTTSQTWDMAPSFIGVECIKDEGGDRDLYVFKAHFLMDKLNQSSKHGLYYYNSAISYSGPQDIYETTNFSAGSVSGPGYSNTGPWGTYVWSNDEHRVVEGRSVPSTGGYFGAFWPALSTVTITTTLTDVSDPDHTLPESIELGGQFAAPNWSSASPLKLEITPDKWHHVIISLDLTNEIASHGQTAGESVDAGGAISVKANITSAAKAWLAFDDEDINGHDMSQFCRCGQNEMPDAVNDIITPYAYLAASTVAPATSNSFLAGGYYREESRPGSVRPDFSFTSTGVPINDAAFGLPADPRYTDSIAKVEMAEFQMFVGVTMDTSVESHRRVFILRDADTGALTPNKNYQDAVDLLGVEPVYAFRKSAANWKNGRNQGTSGDDFSPIGDIKTYRPNPKITP